MKIVAGLMVVGGVVCESGAGVIVSERGEGLLVLADKGREAGGFGDGKLWILVHAAAAIAVIFVLWRKGMLGAVAWGKPARDVKPHVALVWLSCGLLVWLSALVAMSLVSELTGMSSRKGEGEISPRSQAILLIGAYVVSLLVGVLLVYLMRASAAGAGLSARPRSVGLGVVLMVAAWPVVWCVGVASIVVYTWISGNSPSEVAHPTLRSLLDNPKDPWAWGLGAIAVVGAPVQEEIIYRGFLQSAILRRARRVWAAVLLTSALFALAHVGTVPVYALGTLFVLAVCIGFAFERTKSLGVAIGMHVAFNAANIMLAMYGR